MSMTDEEKAAIAAAAATAAVETIEDQEAEHQAEQAATAAAVATMEAEIAADVAVQAAQEASAARADAWDARAAVDELRGALAAMEERWQTSQQALALELVARTQGNSPSSSPPETPQNETIAVETSNPDPDPAADPDPPAADRQQEEQKARRGGWRDRLGLAR